ncbi:MAG: META domain-containing protein [Candidatus Hydrothermarchaeales archaeon]
MKKLFSLTLVLFAALSGCMSSIEENTPDVSAVQDLLLDNEWELQSIGGEEKVLSGTVVTLKFGQDNRITGSGSCNNYFSSYEIGEGNTLSIGVIGATEMYCQGLGIMDQEVQYFKALGEVSTIDVDQNKLQLFDDGGQRILNFVVSTN